MVWVRMELEELLCTAAESGNWCSYCTLENKFHSSECPEVTRVAEYRETVFIERGLQWQETGYNQNSTKSRMIHKLGYIHLVEFYTAVKMNEINLKQQHR